MGKIFNEIRLTFYETVAESVEVAFEEYKTQILSTEKCTPKELDNYIKSLYGGIIRAEIIDKSGIKEEKLEL